MFIRIYWSVGILGFKSLQFYEHLQQELCSWAQLLNTNSTMYGYIPAIITNTETAPENSDKTEKDSGNLVALRAIKLPIWWPNKGCPDVSVSSNIVKQYLGFEIPGSGKYSLILICYSLLVLLIPLD